MSNAVIKIKEQDLVLKVRKNIKKEVWDDSIYHNFINQLTGSRDYQKEAILTALRFMCSGQYQNTLELAKENFENNFHLQEKYTTFANLEKQLFSINNYTVSLDLATGTGKTWVLYGIAAIMLSANKVDQVLVLAPSVTIEEELIEKFKSFATDDNLNVLLDMTPPKIINGSESIIKNCICIENRDAIYNNKRSSILDSVENEGERTLILSDEVHHVFYSEENKWKEFIDKINFRYNIGVSGTCYYSNNDYFNNVIYRYSLKQAMEDNRVKMVEYVEESNFLTKNDNKWQVIINSHEEIKKKINQRPLTLIVTANIPSCRKVALEFKKILETKYHFNKEEIEDKVLVIHSGRDALEDRIKLKSVDKNDSKVEWIFSVSMLTEGWDVKRVFQIVPHEERAFNSKLLIAQVLGRGLRIPNGWNYQENGIPKVIIYNHAKWAPNVKKLVDEVLEIEKKISTSIDENSDYNFTLINVNYKPSRTSRKIKKLDNYNLFEKGYVVLPSDNQIETVETKFVDINNKARTWSTQISNKIYSINEPAEIMWHRFEDLPDDKDGKMCKKYQKEWNIERLKKMIKTSLSKSGNVYITEKLKQVFLSSMGVIFRADSTIVDYKTIPDEFIEISTKELKKDYVSGNSLSDEKVLFWTQESIKYLTEEEKEFFNEIIDTTNAYRQQEIKNVYDFKTPQTMVIADSDPEKKFIKKLTDPSFNQNIIKWIKSNSNGFYFFEYSWRKGEHTQIGKFNPDFFIMVANRVIVVEIKDDDQINNTDLENIGKYKAAINHFKIINQHLKNQDLKYKFTMLTPCSYENFFNKIKSNEPNEIDKFNSDLDAKILNYND